MLKNVDFKQDQFQMSKTNEDFLKLVSICNYLFIMYQFRTTTRIDIFMFPIEIYVIMGFNLKYTQQI